MANYLAHHLILVAAICHLMLFNSPIYAQNQQFDTNHRQVQFSDSFSQTEQDNAKQADAHPKQFTLAIHGGCCIRDRTAFEADPEREQNYRNVLEQAPVSYTHLTLPTILRV